MLINLQEIPNEGKSYSCNNFTGELNEILSDLIGTQAYKTEFTIRPLPSGTYDLTGFVQTELPEQCSRCGLDFRLPLRETFHEMMMPELNQPRNSHYAKANHYSDLKADGPSVVEYRGHHFDMGEYLHEVIALAAPPIPAAPVKDNGDCTICERNITQTNFGYNEEIEVPETPFSSLKNLKLN